MEERLKTLFSMLGLLLAPYGLFGQSQVVPCQLNNPDQDTLRLFPERTNYRTEFLRTDEMGKSRQQGPQELYRELERRLGDFWDPIWETEDIPYVFYEILKGPERIGWVFGANQGWPGADNAQLMVAVGLDERVKEFYYQKLPSLENALLQNSRFYAQFLGLSLQQFYIHERLNTLNIQKKALAPLDMIQRIQDPTEREKEGFQKTLRGLKKILLYLDDFKFQNRIKKEEVFQNVDYFVSHKERIPLIVEDPLKQIQKGFPEASHFVIDLVSIEQKRSVLEERLESPFGDELVYPVYLVYKQEPYKDPFVRASLLGYAVPLALGDMKAVVCISGEEGNKGKIVSFTVDWAEFPEFKGLSLVHFYTKDFLNRYRMKDQQLDRISPLVNLKIGEKDLSEEMKKRAKQALILIDEYYFHNYFQKEEIMKKIEEYKKGKE